MNRYWRFVAYAVAGAMILIAALAAPAAWDAPGRNVYAQTIPTRTPKPSPVQPTEESPVDIPATPTVATATPGSPVPLQTVAPEEPGSVCTSTASLTLVSDRRSVWPGATVVFTATFVNTGRQPLTQIILESRLPSALDPIAVLSGQGAWQGRTMRAAIPSLAAGGRLAIVYSARAAPSSVATAIPVSVVATSAGCPREVAGIILGMPPSELPATGGKLD